MKTNRIFFLLTVLLTVVGLPSCKKFLEKKSSNAVTSPTKLEDLQALLDDASVMNLASTPSMGESSADNYFIRPDRWQGRNSWQQAAYVWIPYEYNYPNDWAFSYSAIYNANYCIDMIDKITPTDSNDKQWKNVYGSALFYRSYYFLLLLWNYSKSYDEQTAESDLGIVLRLTSDFNVSSVRSTVKDCYAQVISDAMKSIDLLPETPYHVYRPSKAASYGLLARCYLSMRNYDSAYKYSDLCLQIKNDLMDYNGDNEISDLTKNYPFRQFNKETIFYSEMYNGGTALLFSSSNHAVDSTLIDEYDTEDLRKQGYFTLRNGYYSFKGSYTASTVYFTGMATDEMYLIKAESAARITGLESARAALRTLLSKRYKTGTLISFEDKSGDELASISLRERNKELFFRGLRWMDIKRLNKEGRQIILKRKVNELEYILEPNANYYALPLPSDIVSITGIQQNEP